MACNHSNFVFQAYYPGQVISGSIQMTLTEPKWYQYVAVHLEGKGRVHWTESHTTGTGDDQRTETRHYSANETYADLSVVVWGNKEAPQPTRIDPGTFNFPFQLTIPPHCPPTFGSVTGKIVYKLFGIISSQVSEYKIESPLIISALIDLNQQPNLLEPINQSAVKNITTCCCCNAGEAQLSLKMPRSGFCVVQERIPVTFECRNGSSRQISARVEVAQSIIYNARGHHKSGNESIGNFSCQIQPSGSDTKSVEFELPPSIILGFTSQIITVSHSVRLWINHSWEAFGGIFATPPISIPVVIGNVPFHGTQQPLPFSSTQPPAAAPSSLQQPSYPPQGTVVPLVAMPEPSVVETPPNAELQSQAPPTYRAVISGEKF